MKYRKWMGEDDMFLSITRIIILSLLLFQLSGCASIPHHTESDVQDFKAFEFPKSGLRIYIVANNNFPLLSAIVKLGLFNAFIR